MVIRTQLKNEKTNIEATIETEDGSLSISFMEGKACINIYIGNGLIAYIYPQGARDPEIIHMATP